ncbi:hypothetical protein [Lewinella sp. W8]|uniref:hypothetical protein n=1 Tax=Lewinella sp. W8 TaxID=2528208 RepID=UPI00106781DD|nr:hypothetical protein [Lewinella sp. W8]MTB50244.1 hypothetical protein [Lewinella sp. W8]
MRRLFLFMLAITASLYTTSCLVIEDTLNLNADGSGTKVTMIDLSDMLSNPMMGMALQENMKDGESEVKDSSFLLVDELAPLNPQWTAEELELVSRIKGRIFVDGEAGEGMVTSTFRFDDLSEIARVGDIIAAANQPEESEGGPQGMASGLSGAGGIFKTSFDLKKGLLSMNSSVPEDFKNPLVNEELGEEAMGMMKMMFEDAAFVYTINLPGKVKKVKGFEGHEVEGQSIVQVFDLLEMIEKPEMMTPALTGEIKFKK